MPLSPAGGDASAPGAPGAELPVFSSSRTVTFGDLDAEAQEAFARFIIEQNLQFHRDADGSYVANVRLFDPAVIDLGRKTPKGDAAATRRRRDDASTVGGGGRGGSAAASVAALTEFGSFASFLALVPPRDAVRPKARPLAWLMRLIEEIYDARYAKDTADLRDDADDAPAAGATPFPAFVVEFFTKRYGLRSLIDQTCWDVLHNLAACRREHLEAEIFARFLEEYYDADDLLFFLYVRSVVQKEMGVSFRARWSEPGRNVGAATGTPASPGTAAGPAPVLLSTRDAALVSRVVFGSEADPLYKAFMAVVERNVAAPAGAAAAGAGRVPFGARARPDARRIDAARFLQLALIEYHETRPADGGAGGGEEGAGAGSAAGSAAGGGARGGAGGGLDFSAAGSPTAGSAASASGGGGGVRPSPALLEALGEAMHGANEAYLDRLLADAAPAAGGLPDEVRGQIRAEAQTQLEAKVDGILAAVITAASGGAPPDGAAPETDALAARFAALVAAGAGAPGGVPGDEAEIAGFCGRVLDADDVRRTVEPLVGLLVQYAQSRLAADGEAGGAPA